jgi:hypothetical protein
LATHVLQDPTLFDESHKAYVIVNQIFSGDLNLDDTIGFCPHAHPELVHLLA